MEENLSSSALDRDTDRSEWKKTIQTSAPNFKLKIFSRKSQNIGTVIIKTKKEAPLQV
jgi:hypothetical protein